MSFKILLLVVTFFILSCGKSEPIKVGFISNLSGRHAELGIRGRDGVLMAIDEVNNNGGIGNRKIELIIKDHLGDRDYCYQLTRELVTEGVEVIIGPMASSMAQGVIEGTKESDVLVISPTVSTDILKDIDDNFLRITAASSTQGISLGTVINARNEKSIAIIYDSTNEVYAKGVIDGLSKTVNNVTETLSFNTKDGITMIIETLSTTEADALVFISAGIDTALIIQNLAKVRDLPSLYGSSWVKVSNIAQHGGRVIDGMIVTDNYQSVVKSENEMDFYRRYKEIYNITPTLPGIYSYEATKLFTDIKKEHPKVSGIKLKDHILGTSEFYGVTDNFSLNSYGDVMRKQSLLEVIDGEYRIYGEY